MLGASLQTNNWYNDGRRVGRGGWGGRVTLKDYCEVHMSDHLELLSHDFGTFIIDILPVHPQL